MPDIIASSSKEIVLDKDKNIIDSQLEEAIKIIKKLK